MQTTKISIITATYNVETTLSESLDSVTNQSEDTEHIIMDGGSSDNTLKILESYREQLSIIVSEPDDGLYDAMNKGIKMASGDVIGILNADDYYPSGDILKKVSEVFADPSVDACYGDLVYFDNSNPNKIIRYWRSGEYKREKFFWGWMPPHPTFFVRRSVYEKYGLFNLSLGTAADYEIMLRFLLKHRINVKYIPEVLVKMRTGGASNASLSNRLKAHRNDRKAWEINELKPFPWTLTLKPLRKIGQWFVRETKH